MYYKDWKPFYEKIVKDLKLNFDKDKDFIFNYSPKYKNLYLNSIDDPDDFNSSDFINFVGPVNKIKKTYESIIHHLFVDAVEVLRPAVYLALYVQVVDDVFHLRDEVRDILLPFAAFRRD